MPALHEKPPALAGESLLLKLVAHHLWGLIKRVEDPSHGIAGGRGSSAGRYWRWNAGLMRFGSSKVPYSGASTDGECRSVIAHAAIDQPDTENLPQTGREPIQRRFRRMTCGEPVTQATRYYNDGQRG